MASYMVFPAAMVLLSTIIFIPPPFSSPRLSNSPTIPPPSKDVAFKARLIHCSSPESPFYDPNATPTDLLKASVDASLARSHYLSLRWSGNMSSSMKYPLMPNSLINKDYVMKYNIGTPPVETFGIPDTGSSLIWLQCYPCHSCYTQSIPIFRPSKSSTYKTIPCGFECTDLPITRCTWLRNICEYKVGYIDDSSSVGDVAKETLWFEDNIQGSSIYPHNDIIIGCGHSNSESPGIHPPGIVGLSNSSFSLVGQLGFSSFSYCISSSNTSARNYLSFGLAATISGHTTPLLHDDYGSYSLCLEGITVAGLGINIPDRILDYHIEDILGTIFIDTGTTYTMLLRWWLNPLIQTIRDEMIDEIGVRDIDGVWDLCYNDITDAPEIEFHFTNFNLPLSRNNTWIDNTKGQFCLAIMGRNDMSLLGMYQQRDINVGYDLQAKQVAFKLNAKCK